MDTNVNRMVQTVMSEQELRALLQSLERALVGVENRIASLEVRLDRVDSEQWDSLNELRVTLNIINTTLAGIKAQLTERCAARGEAIKTLQEELRELRHRVWFFSGAAAVVAVLAQTILGKLL